VNDKRTIVYAGFWRRLFAVILDTALFSVLLAPIFVALYGRDYFYWQSTTTDFIPIYSVTEFFLTIIAPIILTITFWNYFAATPGKLLLDCRIVDANTQKPMHWKQASMRYLFYLASILPFYLGFIWIGFDKHKQGFHDKLAKTQVLHIPHNYAEVSLQELMEPFE